MAGLRPRSGEIPNQRHYPGRRGPPVGLSQPEPVQPRLPASTAGFQSWPWPSCSTLKTIAMTSAKNSGVRASRTQRCRRITSPARPHSHANVSF